MRTRIKATMLCVAFALSAYSLVASSNVNRQDEQKSTAPTVSAEQLAHAKTLFKERCSRCHGLDGDGATTIGEMLDVPDFTDPKWWGKQPTDARLINSVTNGKNEMPAFGRKITKREIESLIAYVRLFNKEADTKSTPKKANELVFLCASSVSSVFLW